ncbi:phosphatase PAP2 family protein [Streptomyces racemochromogenes]|uniref:Phosphatase PAP2 family protein n=1 Tax=Streptomyces racemochromogenes TaxID=67353 RepID=A0ABW7PG31_9ACTN
MADPVPDPRRPPRPRGVGPAARVALAASAGFALLALWVLLAPTGPLPFDAGPHTWSAGHRPSAALTAARAVTGTGTGIPPYALVVLAGLYAGRTARQRLTAVAGFVLCLAAGQAVRRGLMYAFARPRPPAADWAVHADNWAFPSGHATTGALTAGLLLAALALRRSGRPPVPAAVPVLVWGAAVGLSRVYLGVHWLSDVLAGWLLATAWLALAVLTARWYVRRGPV